MTVDGDVIVAIMTVLITYGDMARRIKNLEVQVNDICKNEEDL